MTPREAPCPRVTLYTDGACSGNPGPGGWGAVLISHDPPARKEIAGAEPDTTNNRMELTAVIRGLERLRRPCELAIVTDSRYVHDAFARDWVGAWLRNGWRTASKKPVKNRDLWERLIELLQPPRVSWQWIRGHSDHPENECADRLAVAAREQLAC